MCGILGTFPKSDYDLFKKALDKIAHRGPDGYGIWQQEDGKLTFGHRRLAILDLSDAGKQPMHYEHYTIVFNGEIYNFLEVRNELKAHGYEFFSESDTEVVVAAFDKWREGCLEKFNGMWAMAIWDEKKQELFFSRDRFGKKPLFYAFEYGKLIFGSEMKAIMPFLDEIRPAEDFRFFADNLFLYENTERCLIDGIKRFPAGSYAYFRAGDTELQPVKFWETRLGAVEVPKRYEEQVEKFRELLLDACKIRMRSDVPIGTALSGGVDSSVIISAMAHIGGKNLSDRVSKSWQHAFVATFPGSFIDEAEYAKKVVENIGVAAEYVTIDPSRGIDDIFRQLYLFEELYLTSPVPMMSVYGAIRKGGVVVSIDGHGADELLSGYGKSIYEAFLDSGVNLASIRNILRTFEGLYDTPKFAGVVNIPKQDLLVYLRFLKMRLGAKGAIRHILSELFSHQPKGARGAFNEHLYTLFTKTILPTLLRNYDRYAMANSVEIRMPFMDYRLVEYCFSLPWESKIRNGYTKAILRDSVKDLVPHEVLYRKFKIGFNTPFTEWMQNQWKTFLLDTLENQDFKQSDLIDAPKVDAFIRRVINDPKASFADGEDAWKMLIPYFWEKSFLKADYKS